MLLSVTHTLVPVSVSCTSYSSSWHSLGPRPSRLKVYVNVNVSMDSVAPMARVNHRSARGERESEAMTATGQSLGVEQRSAISKHVNVSITRLGNSINKHHREKSRSAEKEAAIVTISSVSATFWLQIFERKFIDCRKNNNWFECVHYRCDWVLVCFLAGHRSHALIFESAERIRQLQPLADVN